MLIEDFMAALLFLVCQLVDAGHQPLDATERRHVTVGKERHFSSFLGLAFNSSKEKRGLPKTMRTTTKWMPKQGFSMGMKGIRAKDARPNSRVCVARLSGVGSVAR